MVQLSHPYMTTGKTKTLTRWTFVGKVISLMLFNMLSAAAAKSLQSCPTLCDSMECSMPGFPVHYKLGFIESVMPSNHLILRRPLLLPPSIFPSIRVFSNKSVLHIRWWKYWSFSFSPSNEYSGLISFRIDWFDLLAVQGTLKSLLQHHSSKASILWRSTFLMAQLSNPYVTTYLRSKENHSLTTL